MNNKILITNNTALRQKYGSSLTKIQEAIKRLVSADKARGINTRAIAVDKRQDMTAVRGEVVTNAADPRQNKNAVDAIYKALLPDYIVLLGSIDIIPHQDLHNPLYDPNSVDDGDPDEFAFGDIPYACEAPYSQEPKDFIGPTRVVGRIPDISNQSNADYMVRLLDVAAKWSSRDAHDYLQYFGISAEVWRKSTATSLQNTFGSNSDLQVCPPNGPRWEHSLLSRLSHFINCHGASSSPVFYGQPVGRDVYPDAHLATWINGRTSSGTIVAAECCYGSELYNPAPVKNRQIGICSTYLVNGAYGFFGSTTIAYGPAEGNGTADLISQYFLQQVIAGSSLGRAALEARQRFAQSSSSIGPDDIKTLAQYTLLGDPSIQPVSKPKLHEAVELVRRMRKVASPSQMIVEQRAADRRRLFTAGINIGKTQPVAERRSAKAAPHSIAVTLKKMARAEGVLSPAILSFDIGRPRFASKRAAFAERISAPTAFHVAIGRSHRDELVNQIVLIVAMEQRGTIISLRKLQSR